MCVWRTALYAVPSGEIFFSWPPTPQTWDATLREVLRCTRDGIRINTFMLERSTYLMKFVNDLSKINGGRVFFASPDHLGECVLVDYVRNKRKWIQEAPNPFMAPILRFSSLARGCRVP